jgi:hypothetical protein
VARRTPGGTAALTAFRWPRPRIYHRGVKERWTVRWFRKRALLYHLLVLIIAPGCLYAGWWQVHRAEAGNTLSYLYSVEWPIFAILSIVGWWQLIHEDPAAVESRKVERARRAAHRGPYIPPPPEAESGFYHPLQPGSHGTLGPGDTSAEGVGTRMAVTGDTDASGGAPVHALSSYNAYLARLSAGGARKSWRNPRGIPPTTVRAAPPGAGAYPDPPRTVQAPTGPSAAVNPPSETPGIEGTEGTEERTRAALQPAKAPRGEDR